MPLSESRASPTLVDVARAAGVSPSTASRVLNGGKPVSPSLTARVTEAAGRLGYVANVTARALRGRRNVLALIADDIGAESIGEMMAAMEAAARRAGAVATVSAGGGDHRRQMRLLDTVRALRPLALILTGTWIAAPELQLELEEELRSFVENEDGRVVLIGEPRLPYPTVSFDEHAIGVLIARHMTRRRLRSAVILAGPPNHHSMRDRTAGIQVVLAETGVDDVRILRSREDPQAAAEVLRRALRRRVPDAVLAANDRLATGALHALEDAGLGVPENVTVSGIDDIPIAQDLFPGLTTVALPFAAVGEEAVRLAVWGSSPAPIRTLFGGHLVVRESS
jgi:LacI family transcriptional regulator